jgi:hypothetical protein
MWRRCWCIGSKEGKRFFFEKKKQKVSVLWALATLMPKPPVSESFLLLFFKKEALAFP